MGVVPYFFILESLGIIRAIWAYRHIILSYYDIYRIPKCSKIDPNMNPKMVPNWTAT